MSGFWKKYHGPIITVLLAAAVCGIVICYEAGYYEWNRQNVFRILSDGLFVSGSLFTCFGVMMWISGAGGFDGILYLGHMVLRIFHPFKEKFESRMQYLDFKRERRKKKKSPLYIPVTGIVFCGLSLAAAVLYGAV